MSIFTVLSSIFGELMAADAVPDPSQLTTFAGALTDEGADSITAPVTDLTNGWFLFPMQNGAGHDLRVFGTGSAGGSWQGRLWTVNRLKRVGMPRGGPPHWVKTPHCDLLGTLSSNAIGVAGGQLPATYRWATGVTVPSDGGLLPYGTRVMQHGIATQAKSRIIIDPVCAQFSLLQLRLNGGGTTGLGAVMFPWQRS